MQTKTTAAAVVLPVLATLLAAGCRGGDTGVPEASAATTTPAVQASAGDVALRATDGLQLVVAPDGNEVRYRVREQLVGVDLPNDAIGATSGVSGGIAFDAKGNLVPASSKFTVNVGSLKSDKDRRDGYVRGRILQASQYPTVALAPTTIKGLTLPLPSSGSRTFQARIHVLVGAEAVDGDFHAARNRHHERTSCRRCPVPVLLHAGTLTVLTAV